MTRCTWKVYGSDGRKEGEAVYGEMAAAMVAVLGDGATVRTGGGQVVWREGAEEQSAGESYDTAALTMCERGHSGDEAPEIRTGPPENGCDRCWCGCKYWDGNKCIDCGEEFRR